MRQTCAVRAERARRFGRSAVRRSEVMCGKTSAVAQARGPRGHKASHTCTGPRLLNHCLTYFGFSRKSVLWPGPITLPMCFALLRTRCGDASSICFETSRRPSANCMHSSAWAAPPFQNISALFVQQASCDNPNAAPASSTASCQDNSARSCAGFASMQFDFI